MTERPALKYRSLLTLLVVGCFAAGLSGADNDVFDSNGVKIHYVTAGSGEAVVLIHGWMADSGMWGRRDGRNRPRNGRTSSPG